MKVKTISNSHYALLALLFGVGLELVFAFPHQLVIFVPILLGLVAIGMLLLRWEEAHVFAPIQMLLPALVATGLTSFALFIPIRSFTLHSYFLACVLVLYFVLRHGAKQAYPTWNWIISLIALFINTATLLSWHWYAFLPMLGMLGGICIIVILISYQSFKRLEVDWRSDEVHSGESALLACSLGIALAEVSWVLQFLPAHPITAAGVIVALYYVFFQVTSLSLRKVLVVADLIEYGTVGVIALGLVLVSTRWT